MSEKKRVCVYCSSSSKIAPAFVDAARELGKIFAKNNIELVYGGGSVGLMGVLADSVLENGGTVIGVIPQFMVEVEWQHNGVTELILTETMHERKEKMAELADAFMALPGGFGTLEELLEIITWKQLGIHSKPIVLLNTEGYYDHLLALFERGADELFVRPEHLKMWSVVQQTGEVMQALEQSEQVHENMRNFAKI